MVWCEGLESVVKQNVPLADRTSFRIGGPAAMFCEPRDECAFAAAYAAATRAGLPVFVLGGGSNLLVSDEGVPGVVLSTRLLREPLPRSNGSRVYACAGMPLRALVAWTIRRGLSGLECLAGIPGTLGGAVRMNAGGRHGSISACVEAVLHANAVGALKLRPGAQIAWRYRGCDLDAPILAVEMRLHKAPPAQVRARWLEILREKQSQQPVRQPSAGCFFRNPDGDSAGRLIDEAGLKGLSVGGAAVSSKHANFIVNLGAATSNDVLRLTGMVRDRVRERSGITLESEVRHWTKRIS